MAGTEVDTSIYNKLAPPNPLDQIAKFQGIRAQANQNLQFQTELRARMAMGKIMQQSVGPDGQPNYTKAATLAAQDPSAAFLAPDLMSKAVQMQGVSLDNVLKQYEVAQKKLELTGNAAASVLPKGDSASRADFVDAISRLSTSLNEAGVADKETYDHLISAMSNAPQGGQQLHEYLRAIAQQANGAKDSMDRLKMELKTVDTGNGTVMMWTNPQTGETKQIGMLAKSPSPSEANALISVQQPDGTTVLKPRAEVAPMLPAGSTPGPQGSTGYTPPVASLGPYHSDQLKNIADYQKDLNGQVSAINYNIQNIQQLRGLADKVQTGWGAEERAEMGRMLKAFGAPEKLYNSVANGSLESSQRLMKFATPAAMDTLREHLGNQSRVTNMEFGAFQRANPNLETDPEAFKKILTFTHGLMRLKQQEQKALGIWTSAGKDPTGFPEAWTNQLIKRGIVQANDSYTPYGKKE